MNKKKKVKNFSKPKRAFDSVMAKYRVSETALIGSVALGSACGAKFKRKIKPSVIEFRADVLNVIKAVIPNADDRLWFMAAYSFDSPNPIDIEMFVGLMLGDRRHSYEQRMGQRFLDLGIYPTKKYFSEKPHEKPEV
jgi:hypothetical protein